MRKTKPNYSNNLSNKSYASFLKCPINKNSPIWKLVKLTGKIYHYKANTKRSYDLCEEQERTNQQQST